MGKKKETVSEVAFGGGLLRIWRVIKPLRHYGESDARTSIGVTFVSGRRALEVMSTEALRELASQRGVLLKQQVAADPAGFAAIYGILLEVDGRIVSGSELWGFLDESYGLSSANLTPRVENGCLRFTVGVFRLLHDERYLIDMRVDLHSGEIEKKRFDFTQRENKA
jgi:hypothetical protein